MKLRSRKLNNEHYKEKDVLRFRRKQKIGIKEVEKIKKCVDKDREAKLERHRK